MSIEIILAEEADSLLLGRALANCLPISCTVFLHGGLGAGKTTLVRSVLRNLGVSGPVPSPTYTLAEIYAVGDREVQHFDLYRLADSEEFELIGARDYFATVATRFIEWPERGAGVLPVPEFSIALDIAGSGRACVMTCAVEKHESVLLCISNSMKYKEKHTGLDN
jgi:tRNA threonylcarbamoyladenosine biosynthesis protein TsaE